MPNGYFGNKSILIIDTSVLMYSPDKLKSLGGSNLVIIPLIVIQELEKLERGMNKRKRDMAGKALSLISIYEKRGVIERGGSPGKKNILIYLHEEDGLKKYLPPEWERTNDDIVIASAMYWQNVRTSCRIVVISKDTGLRLKAYSLGLNAHDYRL